MVLEFGQGFSCFGPWLPWGVSLGVVEGGLGSALVIGGGEGEIGGGGDYFLGGSS